MNKFLNIEIPKGYEIDKENSTFEKIAFKPKNDIKCSKFGVEVNCDGEHFIVKEMSYRFAMPWDDAMGFCNNDSLPTRNQLLVMFKYKDKINKLLKQQKLEDRFYWSCEQFTSSHAWSVGFNAGHVSTNAKSSTAYVRPVQNL